MDPARRFASIAVVNVGAVSRMIVRLLSIPMLGLGLATAQAQVANKFHITPEERAACQLDATTLCSYVFPDEDALITCMKANVANLTPKCRKTFTAGLQRRHM